MSIKRQVTYQWRLRETMVTRGLFTAADLVPLLAERGITLSAVQVWRLVTQTPERLSLPVLAALCDILDVTPDHLIATHAENVTAPKAVGANNNANNNADNTIENSTTDLAAFRPKRAQLRPER